MERDGLDDLFLSDDSEDENLEEPLYAKPATTYVGVSTGEKICPDCKRKVLGTNFIAEIQQCYQCLSKSIEASDSETDGFCSSVSSSSQTSTYTGYTDNSAKSSPLNATKLELGTDLSSSISGGGGSATATTGMLSDLNPILYPVLIFVFTCTSRRSRIKGWN
jgi:hypothetical protein